MAPPHSTQLRGGGRDPLSNERSLEQPKKPPRRPDVWTSQASRAGEDGTLPQEGAAP